MDIYQGEVPRITTEQMIEVDRLMIEEYRIELIQMMENAGRALALLAHNHFLNKETKKVVVLAGTGGNGGGALVCARRLSNWGHDVSVYITDMSKMTPIPQHQLDVLNNMNVPVHAATELDASIEADLIVDGIIGYSINGDPRGTAKDMIDWANNHTADVLSLDTPSGIDLTVGTVHTPSVNAVATLTLALPKVGLFADAVLPLRGDLYLGDISVPPSLYAQPSLEVEVGNLFKASDLIRLA